ncbi:hypothetical protein [Streptomyces xiamenensis]|uniref:hypothetical protein n=1 Tax=Streptomyces xiamenensis TaxID=408015 RepID=UPI0035DA2F72
MSKPIDLDEVGTDELHAMLESRMQELPLTEPVRQIWEQLNVILTEHGPESLPAPWE